uniref:Radical SAM protein n=1 Tax=Strongyloides papillosus TaxID=174720 RepID=A0A0N5CBF8_STREA
MPVNKAIKNVVKRNMDYLLSQINEEGVIDIKLQLHTDGVEIAKSSKVKMWPLNAIIENLPGKVRVNRNNVILIAIHISKKMPDFNLFCQRFVNDFNSGHQAVLYDVKDEIVQKRTAKKKIRCNMLTGDIPAIRSILNLQAHNCQHGCIHCYCESVTEIEVYDLRTNASYQNDLNQLSAAGVSSLYGVKGMSHLGNLIKVPEDVAIDYFHSVLLGPFKEDITRIVYGYQSLNNVKEVVKTPGFVQRQMCHFNDAIEMSIFSSDFKRKLKPLTEIDNYKGLEWKNLMLYAMPTIMSHISNGSSKSLYLINLSLANAVILLMKDNVNAIETKKCQKQLYQWYNDRTAILGNEAMTLKVHQMTHLAKNRGTLWQCVITAVSLARSLTTI